MGTWDAALEVPPMPRVVAVGDFIEITTGGSLLGPNKSFLVPRTAIVRVQDRDQWRGQMVIIELAPGTLPDKKSTSVEVWDNYDRVKRELAASAPAPAFHGWGA